MPNLNQLTNILSQNLTMNKARLACLALMVIAIIQVQNSTFKKIARGFITGRTNSNYRRIQRLLAEVDINEDGIAKFIYQLFRLDKVNAMSLYAKRWEIETLFSCFKRRGFKLENMHLTEMTRVSRLVAICAIAFCWANQIGIEAVNKKPKRQKLK